MKLAPLWQTHFTREIEQLEAHAAVMRDVSPNSNTAEGIEWCVKRLRRAIDTLANAGELVTPREWGMLQPKVIPEQTVRRWIHRSELDAVEGARGWLVPRNAERRRRAMPVTPVTRGDDDATDDEAYGVDVLTQVARTTQALEREVSPDVGPQQVLEREG